MNKDLLKGCLAVQHLTFKDLASKMNISKSSLSKKINGKSRLTLQDIIQICKILDISGEIKDKIFFS